MPAEEAHGLGLIARLVEPEQLPALREEILLAISKAPPLSMRLTKQAIDLGEK